MSELKTIQLPDIGDFDAVEIIEVLVNVGDVIAVEDSLITVESDKASMEIPSPMAGTITSVLVNTGEAISLGNDLVVIDVSETATSNDTAKSSVADSNRPDTTDNAASSNAATLNTAGDNASKSTSDTASGVSSESSSANDNHSPSGTTSADASAPSNPDFDLVVIGAGPGGYTAAFRAADLGLNVCLIERYDALGGVCLNVGCIPSKALLHTAAVIDETRSMAQHGVSFAEPTIDIDKLRGFKEQVIGQLTGGLAGLAKQRKVTVMHGMATFSAAHRIDVTASTSANADKANNSTNATNATNANNATSSSNNKNSATADTANAAIASGSADNDNAANASTTTKQISFTHAIIAAGSQSIKIPGLPYDDERLMDSTGALALADIPKRMLVIGGGIIGLEMGCVYAGLGSDVTIVELSDGLMPGCDRDLVRPLEKRLRKQFENIFLGAKVTAIDSSKAGLVAQFDGGKAPASDTFDRVLLAVGRSPNGRNLNADAAGVNVDERGFIAVDSQQRTNVAHIFAIGDIVGQPMLAHKATHEGKVAAEVACGHKSYFDAKTIPSVAYTDPEVAWMGLTETEAKANGTQFEKASFPWAASGRSLSMGRNEGLTKIIYDPDSKRILGAGMVGPNAGELIAEAVLALEMGADIEDIALTVHPHPTLSETFNFAAEVAEGTVTDIYLPKRKK